jgi:hypothetical protein
MEYLFDRSYNAIAGRAVETPWRVEVYPVRQFLDAGPGRVSGYYYTDSISPRRNAETLALCEKIMSRFVTGLDVRHRLDMNSGRGPESPKVLLPKTGAKYLRPRISRKKMEEIGSKPSPRITLADDLLS